MKKGNTAKKVVATALIASSMTIGAAGSVLAQPNGYYVNGTEYLFSDIATKPTILSVVNSAMGGDLSKLALDINGTRANYKAALDANGGTLTNATFNSYAGSNPYTVPAGSTVYNPADPTKPITNTDATASALAVSSVSAINATQVQVTFNKAIDATKVLVTNFSILDKNNQSAGAITGAVLSTDGTTITLTTSPLSNASAPYTLMVNPNAFTLASQSLPITIATTAPAFASNVVNSGTQVTITANNALYSNAAVVTALAGATVTDLTVSTNVSGAVTAAVVSQKLQVSSTTSPFFIAGHNYKVSIPAGGLLDVFGNTNTAAVDYNFSVANNATVPTVATVSYVQSKATPANIDAIVTFNIPVVKAASVTTGIEPTVVDVAGYTSTANTGANVILDSTDTKTTQTTEVSGLALTSNQILITAVNSGSPMLAGKVYGLELAASTVKDTTLNAIPNAADTVSTMVSATNPVDLVAPAVTLASSVLNSATNIQLAFSKPVTYDTTKPVTIDGFSKLGVAGPITATVAMSSDGKSATLVPATTGEIFGTTATAKYYYASGAFKDAAGNLIADNASGTAFTTAIDHAAPVLVSAKYAAGAITLTFSEAISPVTTEPTINVDGRSYTYAASGTADGTWTMTGSTIVIHDSVNFTAAGDQVTVAAGTAKDAATSANTNAVITVVSQ